MTSIEVHPGNRWYTAPKVRRCSIKTSQQAIYELDNVASEFVHIGTPMPAFDQTYFHVSTNGKELLVAAALHNSMGERGRNESVEIFFDPYHDHLGFFQFYFAPEQEPTVYHHLPYDEAASTSFQWLSLKDYEWRDSSTTNVIGVADVDRWFFARFNVAEVFRNGACCGFNVTRCRNAIAESASWNLCGGNGFVDATSFGHLYLGDQPIEFDITEASLTQGRIGFSGTITGRTKQFDLELCDPLGESVVLKVKVKDGKWRVRHKLSSVETGRYRLYPRIKARRVEPEFFFFDVVEPRGNAKCSVGMFYDVPDDIRAGYFSPERLEQQITTLSDWGVDRLYWIDYGPTNECKSFWEWASSLPSARKTHQLCGDMLPLAADISHRRGMEFIGVYKIFDLGFSDAVFDKPASDRTLEVENRYAVLLDSVAANQLLTVRSDRRAHLDFGFPITQLKFSSESPIGRVSSKDVRLWVSSDNRTYKPYRKSYTVRQGEERAPHCRWTPFGLEQEKGTRPNWFIRLSGLKLDHTYVAIEVHGHPLKCVNRNFLLVEAADAKGNQAPVVMANAGNTDNGFVFGKEWPGWANQTPVKLKKRQWDGALLGLAFWQQNSMPQTLEPMHPETREIWLTAVQRLLDAGVDGVDIRMLCHHVVCHDWLTFAFAEPVQKAFHDRFGRHVEANPEDYERIQRMRGEAITEFLREAKQLTRKAKKKLITHFECGVEVPPTMHQRMAIHLDWKKWMEEGLVDELTAKYWDSQSKFMHEEVMPLAKKLDIPVHICERNFTLNAPTGVERAERLVVGARDAGFAGYAFYEAACYLRLNPKGHSLPIGHADKAIKQASMAVNV